MIRHLSRTLLSLTAASLLALGVGPLQAQDGTLQGTVTGETGEPLPNVTVQVLQTDIGILTDDNGRYRLTVPPGTYEVRASSLGYSPSTRTVQIEAGGQLTLNFQLDTRAVALSEMVVSLSAAQERRAEIGTDLERFDAEEAVESGAVRDLSELLNARASGLTIQKAAGSAGAASQIRVRGSTSITQDNNPIIYIDGVRASNATGTGPGSFDFGNGQTISRLDDVDPGDIASVQVLKGPTAAALYGSEAAAGVILIETKSGRTDQQQFTLNIRQGVTDDVKEYWDNYFNLTANAGITDLNDPEIQQFRPVQDPFNGDIYARHNPLEDPLTSPFRTAHQQEYGLSLRGGVEGVQYYGSLHYDDEEGTFPNNYVKRFNFRGNFSAAPHENVDVDLSSGFVRGEVRLPDNDRSAVGMITNAGAGLPIFSFGRRADGSRGDCLATFLAGQPESLCEAREGNLTASFANLATIENIQEYGRFTGSLNTRWRPAAWLSTRATAGLDYVQTENRNLVPLDPNRPFGSNSEGLIEDDRSTDQTISLDVAATANLPLSERVSSATTVGAQYFAEETEIVGCNGDGFASRTAIACNAALTFSGFSDRIENNELGAFLQQRFGLDEYAWVTASIRIDDNSSFGENLEPIWSPSLNASAVLSDMAWWNVEFLSDFRLRAAWGKAAQAPDPFAASRTLRPVRVVLDDVQETGVSLLDPGNPDLAPERNEEFEVGVDGSFLTERFNFKLTYYDQTTTDAIVPTSVAPSTGFSGTQFVNIGEIANRGVEAQLGGLLLDREGLQWEADLKVSTQDPVITDLGDQPPILFGLGQDHLMFREGFAPGAYFGWIVTNAERDENGDIIPESVTFMEGDVGPDGGPDPDRPFDRHLGDQEPSLESSLSTGVTLFDRLRLFTLFDAAVGMVKFDQSREFRSPFIPNSTGSRRFAFRRSESTPEEQAGMELGEQAVTPIFTEDADYLKWRELTVHYDLPANLVARAGPFETATVSLGARNLATVTGYGGLDPELRFDGGRDSFNASEFFTQPPGRSFFASLRLTF